VTQKKETVLFEVLTDIGPTLKTAVDILTQNQRTVKCEVLTDIGQIRENSNGQSGTEPRNREVWHTDRQWRNVEESDIMSQKQEKLQCEVLEETGQTLLCEVYKGIRQTVEDSSGHRDTETRDGTA